MTVPAAFAAGVALLVFLIYRLGTNPLGTLKPLEADRFVVYSLKVNDKKIELVAPISCTFSRSASPVPRHRLFSTELGDNRHLALNIPRTACAKNPSTNTFVPTLTLYRHTLGGKISTQNIYNSKYIRDDKYDIEIVKTSFTEKMSEKSKYKYKVIRPASKKIRNTPLITIDRARGKIDIHSHKIKYHFAFFAFVLDENSWSKLQNAKTLRRFRSGLHLLPHGFWQPNDFRRFRTPNFWGFLSPGGHDFRDAATNARRAFSLVVHRSSVTISQEPTGQLTYLSEALTGIHRDLRIGKSRITLGDSGLFARAGRPKAESWLITQSRWIYDADARRLFQIRRLRILQFDFDVK